MDDFIPEERSSMGVKLGVIQIPAEFIVGTKSRGRTNSFARNFMPMLDENSEFAAKWRALCSDHLKVGIHDPIKAYEYMNRYYVEEGNKRVSVLKFFGAVSIAADVTRILPERTGEPEIEIYYEFASFCKYSHINFIELSKKGSYERLQQLLGKAPEEIWNEDEQRKFVTAYYSFRAAYDENGGKRFASTTGDAMLAYIEVFGYQHLCSLGSAELKKSVAKMWEEVALQQEEPPIEVKPVPTEERKSNLFTKVLSPAQPKKLRVAFLHDKSPEKSGWTYGHELGRQYVERVFGGQIETTAYMNVMDSDPLETIERIADEGYGVIFTTSPRLLTASLRAAVEHPKTVIMNCSTNQSHRYIRIYYARMYEAKFIIGAVAGAICGGNKVGYVCDYPIFGQIAGINAFALGVQMVNPQARVQLEWSSVGGRHAAIDRLVKQNVELVSCMDNFRLYEPGQKLGLSRITANEQTLLAAPVWQWGIYYEGLLRRILNGTIRAEYESSSKALNYYWGMSSGVIDLRLFDVLPESVRRLAEYLRKGICQGVVEPFIGSVHIQGGFSVGAPHEPFSMDQIISMDYLVENVDGRIPVYEELTTIGKATVETAGVEQAAKKAPSKTAL